MLAHSQTQRRCLDLLVLQTAGVEPGPELHLQLSVLLLGKLELGDAALQLQEEEGKRRSLLKKQKPSEKFLFWLRSLCFTSLSTASVTSFLRASQDRSQILSEPRRKI